MSNAAEQRRHDVVFVHSGFRTASTWFWVKLRRDPDLCGYYEVLNEGLAELTHAAIAEQRTESWDSHHPAGVPYMGEYAALVRPDGGVAGFPADVPVPFIGPHGIDGALEPDIRDYAEGLIDHARAAERRPVLTCKRTMGRIAGLRQAFGGVHILLERNLFAQWTSVSGQYRAGNDYFLRMLYLVLQAGERDPFLHQLLMLAPEDRRATFESWVQPDNFDRIFSCFLAANIYLQVQARRHCDIVIDVDRLTDRSGQDQTARDLLAHAGLTIDLHDMHPRIDYPSHLLRSPAECQVLSGALVEQGMRELAATETERQIAAELLEAAWSAHATFMTQTAGARAALAKQATRLEHSENRVAGLVEERDQLSGHSDALAAQIAERDEQLSQARDEIEHHRAQLEEAQRTVVLAHDDVEARKAQTQALEDRIGELEGTIASIEQDRSALTAELAARASRIEQQTEQLASWAEDAKASSEMIRALHRRNAELEQSITERFNEVAQLSDMLREVEQGDTAAAEIGQWADDIMRVLGQRPWWWNLLPRPKRRMRELARLKRHGLFDAGDYLELYPDVARDGIDPLTHYLRYGRAERRTLPR